MFLDLTVHHEIGLFNSSIIINSQLVLASKMVFLSFNKEKILDSIHGRKCHIRGKTTLYYNLLSVFHSKLDILGRKCWWAGLASWNKKQAQAKAFNKLNAISCLVSLCYQKFHSGKIEANAFNKIHKKKAYWIFYITPQCFLRVLVVSSSAIRLHDRTASRKTTKKMHKFLVSFRTQFVAWEQFIKPSSQSRILRVWSVKWECQP